MDDQQILKSMKCDSKSLEASNQTSVSHFERLDVIAEMIVQGKSKRNIVRILCDKWDLAPRTVNTLYKEAVIALSDSSPKDKEELRAINLAKLDELYSECEGVRDKLKTIDLVNKTVGIYETNINIGNKEEETFKFDIGVNEKEQESAS